MVQYREEDITHIGQILRRIRESRGIQLSHLTSLSDVSIATLSRLEDKGAGEGKKQRKKSFEAYVEALKSPSLDDPIKDSQAEFLLKLYRYSTPKYINNKEIQLSFIQLTKSKHEYPGMEELINKLEKIDRPAFIIDPLWFVHAMNGSILKLFEIKPYSEYLKCWEAWHVIATKFKNKSPVRESHYNPGIYFPPSLDHFYKNENVMKGFFTKQMINILRRIRNLPSQNEYSFTPMWNSALSLSINCDLKLLDRIVMFEKHNLFLEIKEILTKKVSFWPEYSVNCKLIAWNHMDPYTEQFLDHISRVADSNIIYYASNFDDNHDFHVNNWPEMDWN